MKRIQDLTKIKTAPDIKQEIIFSEYQNINPVNSLFVFAIKVNATDLHITVGFPPAVRISGSILCINDCLKNGSPRVREETRKLIGAHPELALKVNNEFTSKAMAEIAQDTVKQKIQQNKNVDFTYCTHGHRFRVNAYYQRGSIAFACRALYSKIPKIEEMFPYSQGVVDSLIKLTSLPRGMVLVTGPTGSGKSTTLAAMINRISKTTRKHIITLEDPIEYLFQHDQSIINQRELGLDLVSFGDGLRAALREDPDVIMLGEMRDLETMSTALTAAETGHLVLSTLHTNTASETIERVIDVFPPHQQQQTRVQLAAVLKGVISQQLIPLADGKGLVCAVEMMVVNNAIKSQIMEGKSAQINTSIQTGSKEGMIPMDKSLANLASKNLINLDMAFERAVKPETIKGYLK